MTKIFLKILYITGYNFTNARNGKSMSQIPKFVAGEQGHTNLLIFLNSNWHKISFFNGRGFKPGHFDVFDMLFPFRAFLKLQPIIL